MLESWVIESRVRGARVKLELGVGFSNRTCLGLNCLNRAWCSKRGFYGSGLSPSPTHKQSPQTYPQEIAPELCHFRVFVPITVDVLELHDMHKVCS